LNELALFSGIGGGILGGKLLGWRTVCAVEQDPYCIAALAQRQNEGFLSPFPIWDDVCTFDGKPWRGVVDVVSGGFPCTDISVAGKGAGIKGKESGLWSEMARIISEVRPRFAFIENSPMLVTRGLDTVLCDLAKMGFDAKWGCISAAEVGANHKRDRIWIVAKNMAYTDNARNRTSQCNSDKIWSKKIKGRKEQSQFKSGRHSKDVAYTDNRYRTRKIEGILGQTSRQTSNRLTRSSKDVAYTRCKHGSQRNSGELDKDKAIRSSGTVHNQSSSQGFFEDVADTDSNRSSTRLSRQDKGQKRIAKEFEYRGNRQFGGETENWWSTEPNVGRVVNGVAFRVDRLKAIGNGQVPEVARVAWEILSKWD
jgi:DNA (cytosine-5)-methyltransferase 1